MKLESKINYLKMNFYYSRMRKINNSKLLLGEMAIKRCEDFVFSSLVSEIISQELKLSSSHVTQGLGRQIRSHL